MTVVRTRFSPSPTGFLHLGGARTALFNWLFARHHGGLFILRIEDTDVARSEARFEDDILRGLEWLGLYWDEGPYRQSERQETYREFAAKLVAQGSAYYCDCPPEDLERRRQEALAKGEKPRYDGHCRDRGLGPGPRRAVRFRGPREGVTHWDDLTRGPIAFDHGELDDLVLVRADGVPTYNFAVVVDDITMAVSHVIRGDDHIPNTPRQILIYEALGVKPPHFAHIPMILGPDKGKLSKRHGALSLLAYREMGFLPQAMMNFLARLGWSHGDQEIFSQGELVKYFSLEHVGKAAGVFDVDKLKWLNGHYIRETATVDLAGLLPEFLTQAGIDPAGGPDLVQVVETLQPRAHTLAEMAEMARFYFEAPATYEEKGAKKFLTAAAKPALEEIIARLEHLPELSEAAVNGVFAEVQQATGLKMLLLAQPVRLALTGKTASPGIVEIMAVLGKAEVLKRLRQVMGVMGG